jgi:hypothetical protein
MGAGGGCEFKFNGEFARVFTPEKYEMKTK